MAKSPKLYPVTWEGQLIWLAASARRSCRGDAHLRRLAKLKKTVKSYNKEHPDRLLHVINVPCMDVCPKDGVTVCCPGARSNSAINPAQ
jgi:hypothetical protein